MRSLLEKLRTGTPPLRTHPSYEQRVRQARSMLDAARRLAARSPVAATRGR